MYNPLATYRLQLHREFTLDHLERIIPYLRQLGICTVYAAPVFEAVPGSTHGYDVLNPHRINPEIGTEEQLKEISKRLKQQGMGWMQDIVPNHMAFHPGNPWLMDVLEKGPQSVYAAFFDIAWNSALFQGRVMAPFLGAPLEEVIKNGGLRVEYEDQRFVLKYNDGAYPVSPRSYPAILRSAGGMNIPDAINQLLEQMPGIKEMEDARIYSEQWDEFRLQIASLVKAEGTKEYVKNCLDLVNNNRDSLQQIAGEQNYRLCHWQETDTQINYRRFFTINSLISLNIQDKEVFRHHHQFIKTLMEAGVFQGLRVDHIDGLYNPENYLQQLRQLAGEEACIVVEKILEPGENLPENWPIQGNTGYDFIALVNNLFTEKESEEAFTQFYEDLLDKEVSVQQQLHEKKGYILYRYMAGELDNLYRLFLDLNLVEKKSFASFRREYLKDAIGELLIRCPVYRCYGNRLPLEAGEAAAIHDILNRIRKTDRDLAPAVGLLETALLKKPHEGNEEYNSRALHFYQRCMQFTGPLMAKGVEDTLMYTYNRFIGHNEVGHSPSMFGLSPEEFHKKMRERQERWPLSLNASATHDTKRGEDIRARLNVLTDLYGEWPETVRQWQQLNAGLKQNGAPDANDEYFIYQTLVGAYPMPGQEEDDFGSRVQQYLQKAIREAKRHSNWTKPDEAYEEATKAFVARLLDKEGPFWKSFGAFHAKIVDFGIINSLSQVLLKATCPGTPDTCQGCELWDLNMVDPDNRRPVNYDQRIEWLNQITEGERNTEDLLRELWQNRYDGRIKLWLVCTLLNLRREQPEIFTQGHYIPLKVEGTYKDHVLAYVRKHRRNLYLVAVPLHLAKVCREQEKDILELDWKDTRIILPEGSGAEWEYLLLKTKGEEERSIAVKNVFTLLPLALLKGKSADNERGAGVLLHITSLPSLFGIGDMGPEARAFAGFLNRGKQKYWQLLPLNPTEGGQGHSPYSAISSRAGNILLISPELLVTEGLLDEADLPDHHLPRENRVDFEAAIQTRSGLFQKAYDRFCTDGKEMLHEEFRQFCSREESWLNDFAFYLLLKQQFDGKPWYQWPEQWKQREPEALKTLVHQHTGELDKIKWLQFIFDKQYKELKAYCNERDIQLLGDLPFYISYDSADVWSHRDIFCLDEEGNMTGVAGVPPDAFSDDGQLWGMPVYRWDVLKERNHDWWVDRFRRNGELFDLLRLDHFRAFAAYWEVPAGELTAKNGQWIQGPGADFFQSVESQLGELPFVAEDLGDINDAVFQLRDQFGLPGMKVLHFAFDENMPRNEYIPHNYRQNFIVYTGTHDNNTTRGWYLREADEQVRQNIEKYTGHPVHENDIHRVLGRMAYASTAKTAILPLQDILGMDESARMNKPASAGENWSWRLLPGQLTTAAEHLLQEWTYLYNRD